jgi:YVTN family beta-propeller protein
VYVSSDGASTVSVIDTQTDTIVQSIEVGANPHGLAISSDGREVLVGAFGTNQVLLIDTSTDQIVQRLPVPMAHNSALSPDGRLAYVGSQQQGATAVVILDLVQGTQVGTVPLEKTPRGLTLSPDAKQLYVTVAGTDAVQVVDLASQRVVGQIPVGASPHIVMMLPNGSAGLVVSQGPGTLEFFDSTRHTVSRTVRVGTNPHWLAVSSDGRAAFVSNEGSQDVSVVDVASGTVTATVQVGNAPRKIVVQPGPGGQGMTPASTAPAPTHGTMTISDHGTLEVKGQTTIELEADEYYFKPTFLQGAPGQRLKLEIENESGTLHNISLPEQHLDMDIPPKGTVTVEVVFPASGTVRFFCKFHEALGMHGALHVGDVPRPTASTGAQH